MQKKKSQEWWHTSVLLALERQGQQDPWGLLASQPG